MSKKNIIIFSIILAVVLICTGVIFKYVKKLNTINEDNAYLVVKSESSLKDLSQQLKDKSIIKFKNVFFIYAKVNGLSEKMNGGNFVIRPNTSYKDLILKLQSEESDFSVVTIPEGFTFYQIAERLEKNTGIKKQDFLRLGIGDLVSNNIVSKKNNTYYELEGFLYPDTYYIPNGSNDKDVANLMFNRFRDVFSQKYVNRSKELGLNTNDIITIASLIEKEAANDSERKKIAGVIYNRIKKDMLLQIDASVIYAITKGESIIDKVSYNDLKVKNLYNTYINKGLPPGPIGATGKPSIEAALYPEEHDYLYYVANGEGHVFSKTYEEHLSNVKKYIK
ncbi:MULTISPECIES: endolytic transglycosylase MltG [Clostridium]|uniref:Endolytic murein transglycosylase n=1 Tax=Clostridium cibarium TaxID=2762247 RepID=A0ABR8PX71_9CLOT|nr:MULTISPECIES: endolytic transglycosylase MltG [Clostridium]MBD7912767.1 endolytic transglycosylase MltG [Clostridium cibarium]